MKVVHGNKPNQFSVSCAHQVNNVWTLNSTKSQWVDLGIHTEACMTRPETCGAAGGAISLWVKLFECLDWGGLVSSMAWDTSGSRIECDNGLIRYDYFLG